MKPSIIHCFSRTIAYCGLFKDSVAQNFILLYSAPGRARLRLPGAPRLRVVLVPLPIQYLAVFHIFHASSGAHWEVGAP